MGADVTHPSARALSEVPSLATMTASIDGLGARYAAVAANQGHRVEMIEQAARMAERLLTQFRNETRTDPEKIIYLRDGVSEGQYDQVLQLEANAIYTEAQRLVGPGRRVTLTVIIVRKRHHTSFFSTGNPLANIEPGTIVDKSVTHPRGFDFCMTLFHSC
jgi:eukaryotic translation initiation factor 2C